MQIKKDMPASPVTKELHKGMPPVVRLTLSIVFFIGTIIYSVSPIDLIPDLLGPIGWVDDILLWVLMIVFDMRLLFNRGSENDKGNGENPSKRDGFFPEDEY
jgi:uncharacterized membrane protein YkvA (DUF1232 family)